MKLSLVAVALGGIMGLCGHAQTANPTTPPPSAGSAPVFGGVLAPKKPTIEDLMKGNVFTNTADMVMIRISPNLWVGKYEVTQKEYRKVTSSSPSRFPGDLNPVDSVSYNDAMAFCSKLNDLERKEEMLPVGFSYTLPTQAQWESLAAGATLDAAVTSNNSSRTGTAPVGSLAPTGPGVYDIRGNVMEWCLDPTDAAFRVLRGGSWQDWIEPKLRPEFRHYSDGPDERQDTFGFRVILQKP